MISVAAAVNPQRTFERAIAASPAEAPTILPEIEQALQAEPQAPGLWHAKGLLLLRMDQLADAITAFDRAQELAPNHPKVALARAATLLDAGLPAVDAYARALALAPGTPDALLGLTDALMAEGRTPEAIAGLAVLLQQVPSWVPGHEMLARARWLEGERDGFAKSFDEALIKSPQDMELRRSQLVALIQAGQFEAASEAIAKGRRQLGNQPLFEVNEAIVLTETGELDEAERRFAPFATLDDPFTQVRRMRLFLRAGKPDQAVDIFEKFQEHADRELFLPYASLAWRLTGDQRWRWLEGDPRMVAVFDLADQLPPLIALAEHLRSVHRARGQHLDQSVRGGTQTEGNLLNHVHPLLRKTAEVIRDAVRAYVAQLPPPDATHPLLSAPRDRRISFAGSWSVRLKSGGHHSNHVHPMGWISSAMYIALPPGTGSAAGNQGWLTLGQPQAELGLALPPFRSVEPKPARLVLFPSTMWHGTIPFKRQGAERVTIAFDVARPS